MSVIDFTKIRESREIAAGRGFELVASYPGDSDSMVVDTRVVAPPLEDWLADLDLDPDAFTYTIEPIGGAG